MTLTGLLLMLVGVSSDAGPLHAELRFYNGRQTIFLNGTPESPLLYHLTGRLSREPWIPEAQTHLREFAGVGYRLFACETALSAIWTEDALDVEQVKRQLQAIRNVRADAGIMLRITVEPPGWWLDRYPEERAEFALQPGTNIPEWARVKPAEWRRVSFASERWRVEASAQLRALLEGLAQSPEGDSLFAVLVCGGEWGEWFYPGFEYEPDTGSAMTGHFRRWLAKRYATNDALRMAWKQPEVTLAAAEVPGVDVRFRTGERIFRDPSDERQAIDYYQCHQELVASTPLQFCAVVKDAWPRAILAGLFHGYFFHLSHQASGGHLEMQRVLESPLVDFLSSPLSYEMNARFMGGSGHYRCLSATIRAHGKLWMNENDHPTLVGDHFRRPGPFAPATIEDSIATMRRNTAHCFTTGQGMWWFDFGPAGGDGAGGWWSHPALLKEAGDELRLVRELMERPFASVADVLFVYDTQCFYYLAQAKLGQYHQSSHWDRTDTLSFEAINDTFGEAYKSGVVFDSVLLDDLPLLDLTPYRVIVFAFTPYLTDEHVRSIREFVLTPGREVVWVYAPGYTNGEDLDTKHVADIVGMGIEKSTVNLSPELLLRENSLAPGFPETRIPIKVQDLAAWTIPTFQVVDPEAETLGYYGGSREVALARKRVDGVNVWYCALPLRDPGVMREIFRQGGAHVYNQKNDVIHAGGSVLWLHTETGGIRTLTLRNGHQVALDVEPWTTVVLDAESGTFLMH